LSPLGVVTERSIGVDNAHAKRRMSLLAIG
jgi:hypothetical protein